MIRFYAELTHILPAAVKVILAVTVMVISMMSFIASINKAMATSPRANVTVTDDVIRLGDVFDGIKKNADFVLAPAPLPGEELVWNARTLNRVATAFDLAWRPSSQMDQVSIRRLASLVSEDMIKAAIRDALKEDGVKGRFELSFAGSAADRIILPYNIEPIVTIRNISFNKSQQTFTAMLETPSESGLPVLTQVAGKAFPMIDIPALKAMTRRGETIRPHDITTISVRAGDITDDMVVSRDELIGMTPARVIRGGFPVDRNDLDKPVLVDRGELVTMELNHGPIRVTAMAKALESGTKGDIIRLMNVDSKRMIEAQVTGLREAAVLVN